MFFQLLIAVLVVIFCAIYIRYNSVGRKFYKIPGPRLYPLFGNTFDLLKSPEDFFKYFRYLKRFGDVVRLGAFDVRIVNIYNADVAEKLLSSTQFNEKRSPYDFLAPWLGDGLLLSNGIKWQHRRKLLTPAFHFNILREFAKTFNGLMEDFIEKIKMEASSEQSDPAKLIAETTLQIMLETAMGTTMTQGIKNVTQKYLTGIKILGSAVFTRFSRISYHKDWIYKLTSTSRKQNAALVDLHKFTNEIINQRKKYLNKKKSCNGKSEYDRPKMAMLDLLINNEKDGKIDHEGIREEVDTFLFEGHDTTATALYFMMMRIANEPTVQDKIYEELKDIFGNSDRMPTTEDLIDMKYLEMCIKESLRLYPSVPLIARYISQDVQLGGCIVPEGSMALIHIFDIQRHEDVFSEPERFIPERFLPENQNQRNPFSFLAFSAGPRNCIGQKFAMLEMKTVMSTLLRNFSLEPVTKPADIQFMVDIVLRASNPLYVKFNLRT